jgi:hypothetical protein
VGKLPGGESLSYDGQSGDDTFTTDASVCRDTFTVQ